MKVPPPTTSQIALTHKNKDSRNDFQKGLRNLPFRDADAELG